MDKQYFGMAAAEVAAGVIDADLYVKAMAVAQGDEKRGRAIYISLRAEELNSEASRQKVRDVANGAAVGAMKVVGAAKKGVGGIAGGLFRVLGYLLLAVVCFALVVAAVNVVSLLFKSNEAGEQMSDGFAATRAEVGEGSAAMKSGAMLETIPEALDGDLLNRDKRVADVYAQYRNLRGFKALAIGRDTSGATTGGWSFEESTQEAADTSALASCRENLKNTTIVGDCSLFARGYKIVAD